MNMGRPRIGCYPGCIGCSIPLLILAALIAALIAIIA